MTLHQRLMIVLAMTAAPFFLSSTFAAEDAAWNVNSRLLPAPAAASDVLRNSIANTPAPDVAARGRHPQTDQEWEAFIAAASSARSVSLEAVGSRLGVSLEQDEIAGVNVYHVTPDRISPEHRNHLFLYIHGGAYVLGGGDASVVEAARIAGTSGIPTLSIDYRMPPAHPFPAAVDDAIAVYKEILKTHQGSSLAMG
ncbi:MAG: alpha/beta hydrolase, partial [Gammaproteobacteria bacterium]|nr:alpha/beta hydrolase [Gammaproteobacteria bacterium]